jgi:hypothetical protein
MFITTLHIGGHSSMPEDTPCHDDRDPLIMAARYSLENYTKMFKLRISEYLSFMGCDK